MTTKHDNLLKHLRGAQYIVINTCHGGFGLSVAAIKRFHEIKNQPVWIESNRKQSRVITVWLVPPEQRLELIEGQAWMDMPRKEQQAYNARYSSQTWNAREVARDDPALIQVVKELGPAANDRYSNLKVVTIPPDVEWTIEEYDGDEWVAEKHRTWS